MSVRFRIASTIFLTGLMTALFVIGTVAVAFQRFERENAYDRASGFLARVVQSHDQLLDQYERYPQEVAALLRSFVLFEPDTQLYLLDAEGRVLVSTGQTVLPAGFRVAITPVRTAAASAEGNIRMPYVMGDDPERMDDDAVIAARALKRAVIRNDEPVAGYLYLVCHKPPLPPGRLEIFRSSFAMPAMALVASVVALMTLLAAWIVAAVTRPLRRLSEEVAAVTRDGLGPEAIADTADARRLAARTTTAFARIEPSASPDEFGQLRAGFRTMLDALRAQWDALRRLDHFRREGVSNLSHDLRSPLTATAACLETLEQRWQGDALRQGDRQLVQIALRNTRNAAQMVRSLGDLAQLDEPAFELRAECLDLNELLDGIALRYAARAAQAGVVLEHIEPAAHAPPPLALVDVELFERAVANLLDNALKFTPAGGCIRLLADVPDKAESAAAGLSPTGWIGVTVRDTGSGIAAADVPHLFDRHYQSRRHAAPATAEVGRGLGLAIVKRIAELHAGHVDVRSRPAEGTEVRIWLPLVTPA